MPEGTCGAEHPRKPGVYCERKLCVEYHRSGAEIWTDGAQQMPSHKPDPIRMRDVVRRTRAKARSADPETSHAAARAVGDLTAHQELIYEALKRGDATDEVLWARVHTEGISVSGMRTRRKELVDMGLVEDTGRKLLTASGNSSIVWRVK